jgi:hypothetical protein
MNVGVTDNERRGGDGEWTTTPVGNTRWARVA